MTDLFKQRSQRLRKWMNCCWISGFQERINSFYINSSVENNCKYSVKRFKVKSYERCKYATIFFEFEECTRSDDKFCGDIRMTRSTFYNILKTVETKTLKLVYFIRNILLFCLLIASMTFCLISCCGNVYFLSS